MNVFADESGYSGTALMNADAPVFALATCSLSDEIAEKLVSQFLPHNAAELHFAEQYAEHLDRFIDLLTKLRSEYSDQIFVNVAHKPFVTLIKIFDFWIDCMFELVGSTIYTNRRNFALANMTYWALIREFGQPTVFQHLRRFADMMNSTDQASYDSFWNNLRTLECKPKTISETFITQLCEAERLLGGRVHRDKLQRVNTMDLVLTMEKQALAYWSAVTTDYVDYYHDQASEFAQQKALWTELVSDTGEEQIFKIGKMTYRYPLKMRKTTFVKSEDCYQVQLCDVMASAINLVSKRMLGIVSDTHAADRLHKCGVLDLVKDAVWPSGDPADWSEDPESEYDKALDYTSSRVGSSRPIRATDPNEVTACMNALKTKDYKGAYIGLKKIADRRDIFSVGPYLFLGLMTEAGLFVKPNQEQADEWYLKAITSPDRDARFILPLLLMEQDHGCNVKAFLSLLERCAEDGNAEAGYKLAALYMNGLRGHIAQNLKMAFLWAKKTAPHYTESQKLLGCCYHHGLGTKQNLPQAIRWYRAAAQAGDEEALEVLTLIELRRHH